jgi:hypothetical protein
MGNVAPNSPESNPPKSKEAQTAIADEDRRVLLGASLRLLARKFSSGQPISRDDFVRVATFADDNVEDVA